MVLQRQAHFLAFFSLVSDSRNHITIVSHLSFLLILPQYKYHAFSSGKKNIYILLTKTRFTLGVQAHNQGTEHRFSYPYIYLEKKLTRSIFR